MKNRDAAKQLFQSLDPALVPNEKLFYWNIRPRNPVLASSDDLANMFIRSMLTGELVKFVYIGGSEPGAERTVKVSLVLQHCPEGRVYVMGWCPEREANRVFALDLVMVLSVWN